MTENRKHTENRRSKKAVPHLVQQQNSKTKIQHASETFLRIAHRIDDPRTRSVDYPLPEILFIALIAILCGSESYEDIATFGRAQCQWFKQFIPLKNGVPSHDTFRRVLMLLKPETINDAYHELLKNLYVGKRGKHLAIDGKASRGCSQVKGKPLLNMVSAWDTENGICFGQVATKNEEGKEAGEFHAIPKLIKQLDIEDAIVTIDAGGCYAEIADAITDGGGSYAITLKANQPTLHGVAQTTFEQHEQNDFADVACYRETNRGHGRVEERTYYAVAVPAAADERLEKWSGLSTLVMGRFRRLVKGDEQEFVRYYISSVSCEDVERLGQSLRGHWGIENGLHWVLDVCFGEDANRTRVGNGAENLSLLRRLALVMLKQVKGNKTIPNVQFRAAVDPEFRTEIVKKWLMR